MRSLSHRDIVYPAVGVALDSGAGAAGSEVNMEVDVLLDLRFIFCTIPSASGGDKPSLPTAGLQGLGFILLWGLLLTDIFPACTAAWWKRFFRHVQYFVNRVASETGQNYDFDCDAVPVFKSQSSLTCLMAVRLPTTNSPRLLKAHHVPGRRSLFCHQLLANINNIHFPSGTDMQMNLS